MVMPLSEAIMRRLKHSGRAVLIPFFISLVIFSAYYPRGSAFAAEPLPIPAKKAGSYVGRMVRIRGKVFEVYKSPKAIFINFGKDYRRDFTAVIFKGNFKDFEAARINPMNYKGRTLIVSGVVQKYKGRAEIIVMTPAQIKSD